MGKTLKILLVAFTIAVFLIGTGLYFVYSKNKESQKQVGENINKQIDAASDMARKTVVDMLGVSLQTYYLKNHIAPGSLQNFVSLGIASSIPNDPETKKPIFYEVLEDQPEACVIYFHLSSGEKTQAFCSPQTK